MRKYVLQRYAFEAGRPVSEYLCKVKGGWDWSRDLSHAFQFDGWNAADEAKATHACKNEDGRDHLLFAMPVSKPREEPET